MNALEIIILVIESLNVLATAIFLVFFIKRLCVLSDMSVTNKFIGKYSTKTRQALGNPSNLSDTLHCHKRRDAGYRIREVRDPIELDEGIVDVRISWVLYQFSHIDGPHRGYQSVIA